MAGDDLTMSNPLLADLTTESLCELYAQNYIALVRQFALAVDATEHTDASVPASHGTSLLRWTDAGPSAAFDFHNGAEFQHVPGLLAAAAVHRVHAHFAAASRPFHWLVGPAPQPELESALLGLGFALDEEEPAMAADLDGLEGRIISTAVPLARAEDLAITPVTDAADVREWVETWAFDGPEEVVRHWAAVYVDLVGRLPGRKFSMFVGRRAARPVGTGYVWCSGGVAAVHYIVTLPEFRRQGIGAALAVHAMRLARERGYHTAVLTASPFGIGIYRRLGFGEFGNVRTYKWNLAQRRASTGTDGRVKT